MDITTRSYPWSTIALLVEIGLTRRLDPADRIRELGDASVPFLFDTHAVI
jgi:hypothetical protein